MQLELSDQDEHALHGLLRAFEARPVVALTGAGLAAPLGYPTWQKLVLDMLDWLENVCRIHLPDDARVAVEAGHAHLPTVASYVVGLLTTDKYHQFIREEFAPRASVDYSYELECLTRLPVRLWTTTNFDSCLEEALASRLGRNVTPSSDVPFARLFETEGVLPTVVHFHGTATDPETVVLTAEDYNRLYIESPRLRQALSGLPAVTLLFVGYSLEDEELRMSLETTRQLLSIESADHYALLPSREDQSAFALEMRSRELSRAGIRPIYYAAASGDHSQRTALLENLLDRLNVERPSPKPEIRLGWTWEADDAGTLRDELRSLRRRARLDNVPVILRRLDAQGRSLTLSTGSSETTRVLGTAARDSAKWTMDPAPRLQQREQPERPRVGLKTREGRPFRVDEHKLGPSPIVKKSDFESPADAEEVATATVHRDEVYSSETRHLVVEHAKALGVLECPRQQVPPLGKPLMPPPLAFGLSDVLDPESLWRLDSPIIHAWTYTTDSEPDKDAEDVLAICIVGSGLPWIREKIETAVCTLALSVPADQQGMVFTRGVIFVSLGGISEQAEAGFLARVFQTLTSKGKGLGIPEITGKSRSALNDFRSFLTALEQQTGFVEVHKVPYRQMSECLGQLRRDLMQVRRGRPLVWTHREKARLAVPFPIAGFPYTKRPKIGLRLSGDLLRSPEFERLIDAYLFEVMVRMQADAERRLEFWRDELSRDQEKVSWYEGLPKAEKAKLSDVTTGRRIVSDLGIDVSVPEERVPWCDYIASLKNYHIPRELAETEKYQSLCSAIKEIASSGFSLIWRRCVAKVFDCALRQIPLSDDDHVNALFDNWRSTVDGMLRLEWPRLLHSLGIEASDVFRRNCFFDVDYDETVDLLAIYPSAVLDPSRGTVVIDPDRGALVVYDILDEARNVREELRTQDVSALQARLESCLPKTPVDSDSPDVLERVIHESPPMADLILDQVFHTTADETGLETLRKTAIATGKSASAARRFFLMYGRGAFHTAMQNLDLEEETESSAGKSLASAFVNCVQMLRGRDPVKILEMVRNDPNASVPAEVKRPLQRAMLLNRVLVDRFIDEGNAMRETPSLTPAQEVACEIEHAREAAALAQGFRDAADRLSNDGETQSTAFLKTEGAFESAYSSIFSSVTPAVARVLSYLTGEPES